jgi:hypothetical protein
MALHRLATKLAILRKPGHVISTDAPSPAARHLKSGDCALYSVPFARGFADRPGRSREAKLCWPLP